MDRSFIFLLLIIILFHFSCQKSSQPSENVPIKVSTELLYSNSFESLTDTVGWQGYGLFKFYSESSPGGGKQSLYITGGDVGPQAMIELPSLSDDSKLILKLWGRSLHREGTVRLSAMTPDYPLPTIWISFQDTTWKEYADTLLFPKGYKLQLSMDSNGKIGGDILVDQIQVFKIIK